MNAITSDRVAGAALLHAAVDLFRRRRSGNVRELYGFERVVSLAARTNSALPWVRGDTVIASFYDEDGTIMVKRYRIVRPGEEGS